jgi:hypothetical protein
MVWSSIRRFFTRKPSRNSHLQISKKKYNRLEGLINPKANRTFRQKAWNVLSRGYYGVKKLFNRKTMSARLRNKKSAVGRALGSILAKKFKKGKAEQRFWNGPAWRPPTPDASPRRPPQQQQPIKLPPLKLPPPRAGSSRLRSASAQSLGSTRRSPAGTARPSAENRKHPVIPHNLQAQLETAAMQFLADAPNSVKARAAAAIGRRATLPSPVESQLFTLLGSQKHKSRSGNSPVPGATPRLVRTLRHKTASSRQASAQSSRRQSPRAASQHSSPRAASQRSSPRAASQRSSPRAASQRSSPRAASQRSSPRAASQRSSPRAASQHSSPRAAARSATVPRGLQLTAAEAAIVGDAANVLGPALELVENLERLKEAVVPLGLKTRVVLLNRRGTDITIEFIENNVRAIVRLLEEISAPRTHARFVASTRGLRDILGKLFRLKWPITTTEIAKIVAVATWSVGLQLRNLFSIVEKFKEEHEDEIIGLIHQLEELDKGLNGLQHSGNNAK